MAELATYQIEDKEDDKRKQYNPEKFESLFTMLDVNEDGWLDKANMSILIKKIFARSKNKDISLEEFQLINESLYKVASKISFGLEK